MSVRHKYVHSFLRLLFPVPTPTHFVRPCERLFLFCHCIAIFEAAWKQHKTKQLCCPDEIKKKKKKKKERIAPTSNAERCRKYSEKNKENYRKNDALCKKHSRLLLKLKGKGKYNLQKEKEKLRKRAEREKKEDIISAYTSCHAHSCINS